MKPDHALSDLLHVAKMPRSSFYYKEIQRNYHEVKEAILSMYKRAETEMVIAHDVEITPNGFPFES